MSDRYVKSLKSESSKVVRDGETDGDAYQRKLSYAFFIHDFSGLHPIFLLGAAKVSICQSVRPKYVSCNMYGATPICPSACLKMWLCEAQPLAAQLHVRLECCLLKSRP